MSWTGFCGSCGCLGGNGGGGQRFWGIGGGVGIALPEVVRLVLESWNVVGSGRAGGGVGIGWSFVILLGF